MISRYFSRRTSTVFRTGLIFFVGCMLLPSLSLAESATLNFNKYETQIDAADGASICQFDGPPNTEVNWSNGAAWNTYSTLNGFPNDSSNTEYGKLLDTSFSANGAYGMALQTIWFSPTAHQSPNGSIGNTYSVNDLAKQNFSYYEADTIFSRPFWVYENSSDPEGRGHTVDILQGALARARRENLRMVLWSDLHFTNPPWTWQSKSGWKTIPASRHEEICLFNIYFIKWLASRHGIPIHAVSFQNEPNRAERHNYTNEQFGQIVKMMRQKLEEAGMHGVKVLPGTFHNQQMATAYWFDSQGGAYQPYIDAFGHHLFGKAGVNQNVLNMKNVRYWGSSSNYYGYARDGGGNGYDMGVAANMDEITRMNIYHYKNGVNMKAVWQLYNRLGLSAKGFYTLPANFNPASSGNVHQRKNGAVVNPYVRPGMFMVGGSQGNEPLAQYSVDGFAGRGHAPVIIITNHGSQRNFDIALQNAGASTFEVYQADPGKFKTKLADKKASNGTISITVPANSVTALVGKTASTKPRVYLIVKNKDSLSATESEIVAAVRDVGGDVVALNQTLTSAEQDAFAEKRHPVDMPGAACYVIGPSVDDSAMGYRYRTVMAPVVVYGNDAARQKLGLNYGSRITAGNQLDLRDQLDPPPNMLPGGRPLATGDRAAVSSTAGISALVDEITWAINSSGATNMRLGEGGYSDPDPVNPDPTNPDPVDPGPVDPDPVEPGPVDPDPVEPGPVDPDPVDPGCGAIDPINSGCGTADPIDPGPTDPDPVNPGTVNPDPVDPAPSTETTIQAEDYSANSGGKRDMAITGFTGGGYFDMGGDGSWVEYRIRVNNGGNYDLAIRYANGSAADRACSVIVNGVSQSTPFDMTGDWTTWNDTLVGVDLQAGENTIRIQASSDRGGPNIDQLVLSGN